MKRRKTHKEVPFQHTSELPDGVISYIFSKLRMKDLVKTSTLSQRWLNEWGSRMDLIFDPHNMFDHNARDELHSFCYSLDGTFEFARRVDQFMLHYQGAKIRSLRVDFPLGDEHNDIITRLISQGIAKGVERIELLFTSTTVTDLLWEMKPYKFSCSLLSESDSLKYLHLQNCLLVPPIDFSGFKNLRNLVLHQVVVEQDLLLGLFSSRIHLVDLTLNMFEFNYDLNITSSTLCHLNIVDSARGPRSLPWKIHIFALNLSSFEYASNGASNWTRTIDIMAPLLSKFSWSCFRMPTVEFSGLKNLRTIVFDGLLEVEPQDLLSCLFSGCHQLENLTFLGCTFMSDINIISPTLRHLNIIDCGPKPDHHHLMKIHIDTLNLSSFEYGGYHMTISSIKAPRLLKFYWDATWNEEIPRAFDLIASLHQLELAMIMSHSQIARLPRGLGPFQYLRQLDLFMQGAFDQDFFWILNIVMAFPCLQKLFVTIRHSHLVAHKRQRREHAGFSHNELKYVELRGCVGNINEIELASQFLKNVNSLKQITFSPCDIFYMGAGRWTKGFDHYNNWFLRGRVWIREMLKDEVNEQCRLIIL